MAESSKPIEFNSHLPGNLARDATKDQNKHAQVSRPYALFYELQTGTKLHTSEPLVEETPVEDLLVVGGRFEAR